MALYKDGKVYRTLEQQVGYLSEKQNEQEVINEEVSQDIDDLEATVAVLPTKEYVDDADALKADKTYVDTELAKKLDKVSTTTTNKQVYAKSALGSQEMIDISANNDGNSIARRDSLGALRVTDPTDNLDAVNKGTMDTALSGKQETLTTTSVNDGTVSKVIGFSSNGTLCKDSMPSPTVTPANVDSTGATLGETIVADGNGGALWSYPTVEAADILSGAATAGQVLTADGSGSADWQTPSGGINVITINSASGTLSASELTQIQQDGCLLRRFYSGSNYYVYFEKYVDLSTEIIFVGTNPNIDTQVDFNTVTINKSTGAWTTSSTMTIKRKPTANLIDSDSATNGQVLTANGSGGASWKTLPEHSVTVSGTSGVVSDYNKLLFSDSVIILQSGTYYYTYEKYSESSTSITFRRLNDNLINSISVNKTTHAWATSSISMSGAGLNSTGATNGQVLTADGNGNSSWQTPSGGGGTQLYKHTIFLGEVSSDDYLYLILVSTDSTPYTLTNLANYVNSPFNFMGGIYAQNNNIISSYACLVDIDTGDYNAMYCNFSIYSTTFEGIGFRTSIATPTLTKTTHTIKTAEYVDTVTTL